MRILISVTLFFLYPSHVIASEEKLFYIAPSVLAHTTMQMNTAGFWISRHPSPDQLVMTSKAIDAFNARIQNELNLTKDIFALTEHFKTETLVADFERLIKDVVDKGYYTSDGAHNDPVFMDKARDNMNLPGVVLGVAPRYGLVVHYADVRFFPTRDQLYETNGDADFDQVQNSSLDVGTAVAVVHQSKDKKWFYVLSVSCDGWVEAGNVALGDEKAVKDYALAKDFVVVTAAKTDIYLNERMTRYHDFARMGARLPLVGARELLVPLKDKDGKLKLSAGFISRKDIHEGYLPYTPRNIYTQAFTMLDKPYGWGGMYGAQDCSAFLDEVFATIGVILPRDSKNQAKVGEMLAEFDAKSTEEDKIKILDTALGGATILPMKGHIMLYLGMLDKNPYVIQAIWAYREKRADKDVPRVINRVVVSDLTLGEGSQKGSLLKRLSKVIVVK